MNYKTIFTCILIFALCDAPSIFPMQLIRKETKFSGKKRQKMSLNEAFHECNETTPLHWACFNRDIEQIKSLIDKGADVNAKDNNQLTPMYYCDGHIDIMKLLIDHGADPNTKFSSGFTPLFIAVKAKDINSARILIEKGANVFERDICDNTPLRYATLNSTPSMIRLLVKAGANVDARDGLGQTSLFDACRNGNYDNAQTLIELGANVNIKGTTYKYPQAITEIPCSWGSREKPKVLVPHFCIGDGASVDRADEGLTPLHIACFNGHNKIVDLLIKHRANVNSAGDRNGTTPLHMAAHKGHISIVKKLLTARSKTNSATIKPGAPTPESLSFDKMYLIGDGITPLFSAIVAGKLDIVKTIAPMTDVNKKAGFLEITPLHYACQLGHFEIVKELIKNKANPALQLGNKFNAIEIALCHNHKEIAEFLNDLKEKSLPKTIKKEATVIWPSEMMTIIRSPHGDGCSESVIFKTCTEKNCLLPGEGDVYYHTPEGVKPVPAYLKKLMPANHLLHLNYDECKKMGNVADIKHHFDPLVEKTCGDWAWVVIGNNAHKPDSIKNAKKKFDLYVTLPGRIYNENSDGKVVGRHHKEEPGAFEFKVRKTLYETEGNCYHRFYAPKGTVGATDFGAQARAKLLTSS